MKVKGIGTASIALVIVVVAIAAIAGYYLLAGGGDGGNGGIDVTIELVFNDFNDGTAGSNLGGDAGPMSPEGTYDPADSFTTDAYEGDHALSLQYSFPSGQWCGYWMFFYANKSGHDVSGYTALVMWAKGAAGGEKFKVELKDTTDAMSAVYITSISGFSGGLTTGWQKITIPLTSFSGVDLTSIKQVNIVFDTSPRSGTVYLDQIGFG